MRNVDTIIVGGGPAGSSAARELLRAGRECLVLDRKPMPRLKLCAGWVTPKVLDDLEIEPATYPHGMLKLDRMRIYFGQSQRFGSTKPCRRVFATGDQYSIRRIEFDHWLLQRSSVEVLPHTVRKIERDNGHFLVDGQFRCRHLIGAGGTNCPVKKSLFQPHPGSLVVTQEVEYATTPGSDVCTLWFPYAGSLGYAWYVPKVDAVNIGFGGLRSQNVHWQKAAMWRSFVELLQREGCIDDEPPTPKGYSYYLGSRTKHVARDGAYITGDAAGLATIDLAEGIGPAVESGILAARDILGEDRYAISRISKYSLPWTFRLMRYAGGFLP